MFVFACELTFVCPLCFEGFQPDENSCLLNIKTKKNKIRVVQASSVALQPLKFGLNHYVHAKTLKNLTVENHAKQPGPEDKRLQTSRESC